MRQFKIFIIVLSITFNWISIIAQVAPNPAVDKPNKLCYNYDRAGNRIGQVAAWINPDYNPEITCTPNVPEYSNSNFGGIYMYPPLGDEVYTYFGSRFYGFYGWNWLNDGRIIHPWVVYDEGGGGNAQSMARPQGQEKENQIQIVKKEISIQIVPNPNVGAFEVIQTGFDPSKAFITITDTKGLVLYDREYYNGSVNISEFSPGVYILVLRDNVYKKSVQFLKIE